MYKVRNGLFETNSSSSHALVYSQANPNRIEYKLETKDGVLTIRFRDYGWTGPGHLIGFGTDDILASSNDKLDYVMTSLCRHLNWGEESDVTRDEAKAMIANGAIYEIDEARALLVRIQDLCPEIKEVKFKLNSDKYSYPFGSIDHQSQDLLDDEDLIEVIFNKGCLIVIDNDNSNYYVAFDSSLKPGLNNGLKSSADSSCTYSKYNITEKDFEK